MNRVVETYNWFTTVNILRRWALQRPNDAFIIDKDRGETLTFQAVDKATDRMAAWLAAKGIRPGDNIGMLLTNRYELILFLMACHKAGAVANLWNFRLSPSDVATLADFIQAKLIVYESVFWDRVIPEREKGRLYICVDKGSEPDGILDLALVSEQAQVLGALPGMVTREESPATVIYTAGTTGLPKGAAYSHKAQMMSAMQYAIEMGIGRDSIGMAAAPLIHGAALNFFMAYLFVGAKFVTLGSRDPLTTLKVMDESAVTELFAVPTQVEDLLEVVEKGAYVPVKPSLRFIRSGGSTPRREMVERLHRLLGCSYMNTYGMTECLSNVTIMDSRYVPPEKWDTIGQPSFFWEAKAIQLRDGATPDDATPVPGVGQLIVRGPQNISQYYMNPQAKLAFVDGWIFTRDVVEIDEQGYLRIVDRVDETILSGAENIYPHEVESVLLKHPAVKDTVVFGLPDPKWGEVVAACVVPRPGTLLTAEDIEEHCLRSEELARYKRPRVVVFVEEIPRNILGKAERAKIKRQYAGDPDLFSRANVFRLK